jgi:hypothetical protein
MSFKMFFFMLELEPRASFTLACPLPLSYTPNPKDLLAKALFLLEFELRASYLLGRHSYHLSHFTSPVFLDFFFS